LSKEDTLIDSPRPKPVEGKEEKKTTMEQSKEPFLEVVTKEQFINE